MPRARSAAYRAEFDVAGAAPRFGPCAQVADGEAGKPVVVLDEGGIAEPVRLRGGDLAREVEAGKERAGEIPLSLEPAGPPDLRER